MLRREYSVVFVKVKNPWRGSKGKAVLREVIALLTVEEEQEKQSLFRDALTSGVFQ